MVDIYYTGTRAAPYLEDYQRRLLEGAFQKTKIPDPSGIPKQGITGFQPFQTGAMSGIAGLYGYDPATGLPTGTGAQFDPIFGKAQADLLKGQTDIGVGQGAIGTGLSTTAMGIPALQTAIKQYDPSSSNYQQFFNQYQADVTKDALKQMDEQAAMQRNQLQDQAQQVGAFGGSRQAVQEAELDKNILDIKSRRVFQDLANNFQQAQDKAIGTYESGAGRGLQGSGLFGQLGTQQANLGTQYAGLGGQYAGMGMQGANLGAQQFGMQQQGLGQLFQFGGQQQAQKQQLMNEQFRQDTLNQQEPYQRLSYFSDILKGIPSYQQTLQQRPTPYTNPLLGAIGMGLGTYGMLSGNDPSGAFGILKRGGAVGGGQHG
tara:strand:- start:51 stop:1169 length:1119 start_codon:yes stop_codon:yes gene_type:complete